MYDKKVCKKCLQCLSITQFNKNRKHKTGYQIYCKNCQQEYRIKSYVKIKERRKLYYEKHKRHLYKKQREYVKNNRDKIYPKYKVYRQSRKLEKKPCVICGFYPAEGHHQDYSKPLDVMWLCSRHHKQIHNNCLDKY